MKDEQSPTIPVKNPGGRPQKPIDWVDVDKLCAMQCTQQEIASFLDISVDTLDRRCKSVHKISFAEYFEEKRARGRISLRRAQYKLAEGGNAVMLIWLGKQYLGQKDKSTEELNAEIAKHGLPKKEELAKLISDAIDEIKSTK